MKTLLCAALLLLAIPAQSQTFCNRIGTAIICDGDNGSRTIQPLGRNGGVITDDRGNNSYYSNGMILESESQSYREAERRSAERRREMIYGDDRRDRNRSRYGDDDGR